MAKMKAYVGHHLMVPGDWAQAVGIGTHHRQIDVLGYAATKAALIEHVQRLGQSLRMAESLVGQMILPGTRSMTHYGNAWEAVMADLPPAKIGPALLIRNLHATGPVLRVDDDGAFTILGSVERHGYDNRFVPTRHNAEAPPKMGP